MKDILLYAHGGSENHGCEAIVRSTCKILQSGTGYGGMRLFSERPQTDETFGLDQVADIAPQSREYKRWSPRHIRASVDYHIKKDTEAFDRLYFSPISDAADEKTIAMSIGGDNYCYGVPGHLYTINRVLREKGAKTVLWGCSVEPSAIDERMKRDLRDYSLITARESMTYETLRQLNPNTKLFPDPAFALDAKEVCLPDALQRRPYVTINISPMVTEKEAVPGILSENMECLIRYLLEETEYSILLLSHVSRKPDQDDADVLRPFFHRYAGTGRMAMVEGKDCETLKGYIAGGEMLIAARTHASIAAYSSCVPALVIGYSVKSKGIARDLFGTEEGYVIPIESIRSREDLSERYRWLERNKIQIREHLEQMMPTYIAKAYDACKEIERL